MIHCSSQLTMLCVRSNICFREVCQMAKMAAQKVDLGSEKKDTCILVEMVAGVGFAFDGLKKAAK